MDWVLITTDCYLPCRFRDPLQLYVALSTSLAPLLLTLTRIRPVLRTTTPVHLLYTYGPSILQSLNFQVEIRYY